MITKTSAFAVVLGLLTLASQVLAQADTVIACRGQANGILADGGFDRYRWFPTTDIQSPNGRRVVFTGTTSAMLYVEQQNFVGPNLVENPNFEDGNVGFSSGYRYSAGGSSAQGTYSIVTSGSDHNPNFSPCTDAAVPGNAIMALDGSNSADDAVWCQTIDVNPNASYGFGFDLASLSNGNPSTLRIQINGQDVGGRPIADVQACFWKRALIYWNGTGATSAEICIYDLNTSATGNDLAIDDLSFVELGPITLDSFYVALGDQTFGEQEVSICSSERYTEFGLNLGIGDSGTRMLQNVAGCDSILTVTAVQGDSLFASLVIDSLCFGDTLRFDDWIITTDTVLSKLVPAPTGCDTFFTLQAIYFEPKNIEKTVANPSCDGDTNGMITLVNLAGSGTVQYTWDDGPTGPVRENLSPGTYTYLAEDQRGCSISESIVIENPAPLTITDILSIGVRCAEETNGFAIVDVRGGTGPVEFIVEQNGTFFNIDTLGIGAYNLTVRDSAGCTVMDNFFIDGPSPVQLSFTGDTLIRLGALGNYEVSFSGDNAVFSLTFNDIAIDSLIDDMGRLTYTPPNDGLLVATVVDENGCEESESIFVTLQPRDTEFFPNAFSPNEDGVNDRFGPGSDPALVAFEEFVIVDRWGNVLYSVRDCPIDIAETCFWDGKRDDEFLDVGVYVYYASILLSDGTTIQRTGNVTLTGTNKPR
jgi:gliding motility-associated-like protein